MNLIVERTREFATECAHIEYPESVFVYHPLIYAWDFHKKYLEQYVKEGTKSLFLGMNPGPFGMAQTGVPFGEVNVVKAYLHIDEHLQNLPITHPKRPIDGLNCVRSEVSGRRLWGLIKERYPLAQMFAKDIAIMNYCQLSLLIEDQLGRILSQRR